MYRHDRSSENGDDIRGGGVLIAVRKKWSSELIILPPDPNCESLNTEIIFVKIKLRSCRLFVANLYIPPSASTIVYEKYSAALKNFFKLTKPCSNDIIIIAGDFNMPRIHWIVDDQNPEILNATRISKESDAKIIDLLLSQGLNQFNHVKNSLNRILDLVWCHGVDSARIVSGIAMF